MRSAASGEHPLSPSRLCLERPALWRRRYLVATTEPTTRFCLCNVMNYSIFTSTYRLRGVLALRRDAALWRRCCCEEPSRVAASTADAVARSTLLASPDAEAHTLPTTEPRTGTRTRAIKI
eukprot:881182-Prymnesium_polylepis.1